jgi:hypothetical protein
MGFAVVQKDAEPPAGERLQRAFRKVPGLVAVDADRLCKDVYGLLAKNFTGQQAAALQTALKAEGIEAEVVDEAQLPVLPVGKVTRRMEITPEALIVNDPIRGNFPVDWWQVTLIAGGCVNQRSFPRNRRAWVEVTTKFVHGVPMQVRKEKFEYSSREQAQWVLQAEIMLGRGTARFSIEAESFDFACSGKQAATDEGGKFCQLVRELAAHAPHATLNLGATLVMKEPPEFFGYQNYSLLTNELVWMLWREGKLT